MNIKVSKEHGVNPSVTVCPVCGKDQGLVLFGLLPGDKEAPRNVADVEPCDTCKQDIEGYKDIGFTIIVIHDEYDEHLSNYENKPAHLKKKAMKPSPWQFFHSLSVLSYEAVEQMFQDMDMSRGMAYMPLSIAKQVGVVDQNGNVRGI